MAVGDAAPCGQYAIASCFLRCNGRHGRFKNISSLLNSVPEDGFAIELHFYDGLAFEMLDIDE